MRVLPESSRRPLMFCVLVSMPYRKSFVAFTRPIMGNEVRDCIVSYRVFLFAKLSAVVEMRVREP